MDDLRDLYSKPDSLFVQMGLIAKPDNDVVKIMELQKLINIKGIHELIGNDFYNNNDFTNKKIRQIIADVQKMNEGIIEFITQSAKNI